MSAEKVDGFPRTAGGPHGKYPWREIAEDGGIWKLDPAEYSGSARIMATVAGQWASRHGYVSRCSIYEGALFVQFTTLNGGAS